jgi:hypothetical protein
MKAQKLHTIEIQKGDKTPIIVTRDLGGLTEYFGYTLECGHGWNKKIQRYPQSIKGLIKALEKSYDEIEASSYTRTSVRHLTTETVAR